MKKLLPLILLVAGALVVPAHANSRKPPPTLEELVITVPAAPESHGVSEIRYGALRDTAVSYGAQAGLARRNYEIQQTLDRQGAYLDQVYSFQALMVEGNVLPPVLTQADDVYDQQSDTVLRIVNNIYRIETQARFTYAPPTWRAYLQRDYTFNPPSVSLAPKDDKESALWKRFVAEGFAAGMQQADAIFEENMARLNRDFNGMARYRVLLAKGMVTRPFVASANVGTTGTGNAMHVGETVLRITATPQFVTEPGDWKTPPTDARKAPAPRK